MYPIYSCIVPTTGTIYVRIRCAIGSAVSYIFGVGFITLSNPEDNSYVYNSTGNEISWTFQDSWIPFGGTATVFRDGTAIDSHEFSGSASFTINIDNLSLGQHNFTIILTTMTGVKKQDTVLVNVLPNLAISSPPDFAFIYHTTGHYANWTINATFVGVANYSIYHDTIKVNESLWTPTIPVAYCVDDLSVGTHTITIYADDGLGNSTEDTVIIQVYPSLNITNPLNITYRFGTINNNVTWTISALFVGVANYSIYHETLKTGEGFWTSNIPVSFSIDGLSIGTHSFIIYVDDGLGNSTNNTVYVTVANNLVITHSAAEITQVEKSGGKSVTWRITAAISGTTSYTIYRNGTAISSGSWVLGQDITFSLDSLPIGMYNITIIASDGLGWTIQDSVSVTVTPAPPGGFDIWWIIGIISASCGLTSIVIIKRRSKRTANFFPEIKEN